MELGKRNPKIPMEIDFLYVVVFKIDLKFEIIPVWNENFEGDLTYYHIGTYKSYL